MHPISSMEYQVWNIKYGISSMEYQVWNIKYGISNSNTIMFLEVSGFKERGDYYRDVQCCLVMEPFNTVTGG